MWVLHVCWLPCWLHSLSVLMHYMWLPVNTNICPSTAFGGFLERTPGPFWQHWLLCSLSSHVKIPSLARVSLLPLWRQHWVRGTQIAQSDCWDKTVLLNIPGELEGSKFIYWGAGDNTGHLYTQPWRRSLQEKKSRGGWGWGVAGGRWEKEGLWAVRLRPSDTELEVQRGRRGGKRKSHHGGR